MSMRHAIKFLLAVLTIIGTLAGGCTADLTFRDGGRNLRVQIKPHGMNAEYADGSIVAAAGAEQLRDLDNVGE